MSDQIGGLSVSRETIERLELYGDLLRKWNPKINLVSKATLDDLWTRHIQDSAQLFGLAPTMATTWADFGSGGGFPGLVIAIIAKELNPQLQITLVESDQRKCAFLRTVARETECNVQILAKRVENVPPLNANIISARALADLNTLLTLSGSHISQDGLCLFPKGLTWEKELAEARDSWLFDCEAVKSETQENSVILKIQGIHHV